MHPIPHFRDTRRTLSPAGRLDRVVGAAREFRTEALSVSPLPFYATIPLVRVPYPTRFAFLGASTSISPFVHLVNTMTVVQFREDGALKTALFGPSDHERNEATPFFRRIREGFGPLQEVGRRIFAAVLTTVPEALRTLGIDPARVDYISYDHLHTQDLRRWLGPDGLFPNATLLLMREEWEAARGLLPPQKDWYCPGGTDGIQRVTLLEEDTELGAGVWLLRTPGHTMGNHSFVLRTPHGLAVTSENGISADCYNPRASPLPGLRAWAEATGMDFVINGNTLESGLEQYISMVQEREIAGPSPIRADFPNIVPSSELDGFWAFPGTRPTCRTGAVTFGALA